MPNTIGSITGASLNGFYTHTKKNQIWLFHLTTSQLHTLTCCSRLHGGPFFFLLQFPTSSSRITADWTRSGSRGASGPRSPARSWRSWSGFLLKRTTRTSTPEKSWLSKSIWLKPECRYAAPSRLQSAPVTRGGTRTAHWRTYNGTILGHYALNATAFYCFLVKAFWFGHDGILAPHSHHHLTMVV